MDQKKLGVKLYFSVINRAKVRQRCGWLYKRKVWYCGANINLITQVNLNFGIWFDPNVLILFQEMSSMSSGFMENLLAISFSLTPLFFYLFRLLEDWMWKYLFFRCCIFQKNKNNFKSKSAAGMHRFRSHGTWLDWFDILLHINCIIVLHKVQWNDICCELMIYN